MMKERNSRHNIEMKQMDMGFNTFMNIPNNEHDFKRQLYNPAFLHVIYILLRQLLWLHLQNVVHFKRAYRQGHLIVAHALQLHTRRSSVGR